MTTKIICCCHRGTSNNIDPIIEKYPDVFHFVLGGAAYHKAGSNPFLDSMKRDDTGENLSWANPLCSEATSLYWAYKHLDEFEPYDMIGLCHYRRVFDLDYHNLNPDAVYVKQCDYPIPGHPDYLGNHYSDPGISTLVRDELIYQFPWIYEITRLVEDDFTFFDKEMFIMNRGMFLNYMDYVVQCLRILLDRVLPNVLKWHRYDPSITTTSFAFSRGCSYFLEYFSMLYFTRLKLQGYRLLVTPLTKESYHGN